MSKPKFKSLGLDTRNLEYTPGGEDLGVEYIVSSISANNPYDAANILNSCGENAKLVLVTDFLDSLENAIPGYLLETQREDIDLLLIEASCNIQKYVDVLAVLMESGIIKHLGVINPGTSQQLERIKTIIPDLVYVGLDICPLNYNKDVLDWCSANNIQVIGFNQFGGHTSAAGTIETFTAPYLLNFSSLYCDIMIISGRNIGNAITDLNYLRELQDYDLPDKDYALQKSVSKLSRPMKKCVFSSLKIEDESLILPFNNPGELYSPSELGLSFKTQKLSDLSDRDAKPDIIEEEVNRNIPETHRPEDGDYLAFISILRPRILGTLQKYYTEKQNWELSYFRAADNIFVFMASRENVSNHYLLYVDDKTYIFRKLQNGD